MVSRTASVHVGGSEKCSRAKHGNERISRPESAIELQESRTYYLLMANKRIAKIIFYATISWFIPSVASSQDVVTWNEDVSGWEIRVDRTLGNGCFMLTGYEGGTFLRLQFDPTSESIGFYVANDDWRSIEANKLYDIEVEFGSAGPWTGSAQGIDFDGLRGLHLTVPSEDDRAADFIEEFMRYTGVDIRYQGASIARLSLRGTFAATEEMFRCQAAMFENGLPSERDPFSSSGTGGADPFR